MVVTLAIWTEPRAGRNDDRKLPVWTYVENFQTMPSHYYRAAQGGIQGRLAGGSEMRVFNKIFFIAIILSVLFIYALVVICALYPGRQAAAIYPAVALHEE